MEYRSEIDGLRAIAVLAVIFYHAELNIFGHYFFEGGYLGVDIFFVISGYLITHIILSELYETGSFNFKNFYERRARRILPMLFFVMLVSIPFAWKILLPSALIEFAESIFTSIFFSSNFYFYFNTTEYAAESSLLKPLLHTWSLGVEEQFYLIFPILALAVYKYAKKYLLQIVFLLLLGSLIYAEFIGKSNSELNFFLPLSRVWELAVGSLLAYKAINYKENINNFWHQHLPLLGLLLIIYSFYLFQEKTTHPGLITIIPIIGTVLIVGYSSSSEFVGKLLSTKPMVGMGLISYSAYLWHFPIFVYYRNLEIPETLEIKFSLILSTIILSIISYITIEKPFRDKKKITIKKLLKIIIFIFIFFIVFITATKINSGFKSRFSNPGILENYNIDNQDLRIQRLNYIDREIIKEEYFNKKKKVLVVGNSHAFDFFLSIHQNLESFPNLGVINFGTQISCFEKVNKNSERFFNSDVYKVADIIIVASKYLHKKNCEGKINKKEIFDIKGLEKLILRTKSDNKKILVFSNNAEFIKTDDSIPADFIYQKYNVSKYTKSIIKEINEFMYTKLIEYTFNDKIKLITNQYNIPFIDRVNLVCNHENKTCTGITDDGYKTYFDHHHWTLEGSKTFGERLLNNKNFLKHLGKNNK